MPWYYTKQPDFIFWLQHTQYTLDEFRNFYSSSNIVTMDKIRTMRPAGHVPFLREERIVYKIWVGKRKENRALKDLGTDCNSVLKFIFKHEKESCRVDLSGSGYGLVASFGQHSKEPSGSVTYRECLSNY